MKRAFLPFLFLALTLLCGQAQAQEITFKATVDRNSFAVGENIKLMLTLSNAQGRFGDPDLGGLVIVQGPFESSAFNFINGRGSATISRTYLLTATQPGDYTIGPAKALVGGGSILTDPIKVHVEKGITSGNNSGLLNQQQKQDRDLFATITLSRNKCYVGEQVLATYTLYCRYGTLELNSYDLPKLTGFWAEEINMGNLEWETALQTVNGLQYRVAIIKKQLLFPQKAGKLRIDPATLKCVVNRSFFSRGADINVKSNAVELNVLELPPNKPADFTGAVGQLQMEVTTGATTVKANEAIDLKLRFSGRSNLKLLDAPKPGFPTDFEAYDPKVTDKVTVNAGGMSGSREFQYLVIPRHEGVYTMEPITFSYFDPEKGSYQQLTSGPLTFTVEKGDGSTGGAATISRPSRTDVQVLDRDIRYIRTGDLELEPLGHHLFGSWPYLTGMAAPALAFLILLGWRRKRDAEQADAMGMRRKGADKVARQRLKAASEALTKNDREGFYAAMSKALHGYVSDKFALGVAEVNAQVVREKFASLGEASEAYVKLMDACELARFAPFEDKPRQQVYDEAATLITRIEHDLRA
ncbi:MAG: protein BatD [Flavobacteriales bacterium]|nr:protein BatD [Flavobacteriales bacterium]